MQEFNTNEAGSPGEGGGSGSEQVSEKAKERFAEAARQAKQQVRDEKRSRKRDDRLARVIMQFLGEEQHAHMFQLISRLVARDCPSIFILGTLSLIHQPSKEAVDEYVAEQKVTIVPGSDAGTLSKVSHMDPVIASQIMEWATRLQLAMNIDGEKILMKLMVDESNIDGTVLQLTTFVLVEFFAQVKLPIPYEKLQPLTISVLQNIIEPYLYKVEEYFAQKEREQEEQRKNDE